MTDGMLKIKETFADYTTGEYVPSEKPQNKRIQKQQFKDKAPQRGKKRECDDIFILKCEKLIRGSELNLQKEAKDNKEKRRLRNIISANKSRILRKREVIFLTNCHEGKDQAFSEITKCIDKMKLDKFL